MLDLILQQTVNGLTQGVAYALVALGLTMIFGVLHVINFAQGEFYMLGGLGAVLIISTLGLPYPLAVPLAIVGVMAVAYIVDQLAVRPVLTQPDGNSMVLLTTFAFSLLILHGVLAAVGPTPLRIDGIRGGFEIGPIYVSAQRFVVLIAGALALLFVELVLRRTRIGKQVRALAQSPFAAAVVGINVSMVRSITFISASALAGLAGALLVPIALFSPAMGQHVIINAFVIVVIGGMGNAVGAVVCGLALGILQSYASMVLPQEVGNAIIYGLLLLALLIRPQGILTRTTS